MKIIKSFLSNRSSRERTVLFLAGMFLLAVLMDRVVYQPVVHRFDLLDSEVQTEENHLRKNLGYLAARERIIQEHKKYEGYFSRAGSDEEETSALLSEVESLAREADLLVANMKPQPVTTTEVGKRYAVEIEIKGDMGDIIRFIYGLHQSKYLLSNPQFRLGKERASAIKGSLSVAKMAVL